MSNSFLIASRSKLRFNFSKEKVRPQEVVQLYTVEDLWDLSLKDLDAIAVPLIQGSATRKISILENPDPKVDAAQKDNELRLNILKEIVAIRQDENKAKADAAQRSQQLATLKELQKKKQMEKFEGQSEEELLKQIAALEAASVVVTS